MYTQPQQPILTSADPFSGQMGYGFTPPQMPYEPPAPQYLTGSQAGYMPPMQQPMFPNYDPLAVQFMTGGQMGYMPQAQFLTPSGYGAFRTMPNANPHNFAVQDMGWFQAYLTRNRGSILGLPRYTFNTYNPAANQQVYMSQAVRSAGDNWMAAKGAALDFGAAGLAGLAIGGIPGIAASLFMPSITDPAMSRIREMRAIQNMTMSKIVGGQDVNAATGMGFNAMAARDIDKFVRLSAADDAIFKEGDYRKLMQLGIENGLFDYANNANQYKDILKKLKGTMTTMMEVVGSTDFKDLVEEFKRLQTMGATTSQFQSIARKENMFARMTGLSHADLVNTYGQQGALIFSQNGLTNYQGSLQAMSNAAMITMGQRMGLISAGEVARNGGVSGMAQQATQQDATALNKIKDFLLPYLMNKDMNGIRDNVDLARLANDRDGHIEVLRGQSALRDPEKLVQYTANRENAWQQAIDRYGSDQLIGLVAKLMAQQNNVFGSQAMAAGLQMLGMTPEMAARKANWIQGGGLRDQQEREMALQRQKQREEYDLYNSPFRKFGRWMDRLGTRIYEGVAGGWIDAHARASENAELAANNLNRVGDVGAGYGADAGRQSAGGGGSGGSSVGPVVQLSDEESRDFEKATSKIVKADIAKYGHLRYGMTKKGGPTVGKRRYWRAGVEDKFDCSGWAEALAEDTMREINRNAKENGRPEVFSEQRIKEVMADFAKYGSAAPVELQKRTGEAHLRGALASDIFDPKNMRAGMFLSTDNGDYGHDKPNDGLDIDHILYTYMGDDDQLWVTQFTSSGGNVNMRYSEWRDKNIKNKRVRNMAVASLGKLADKGAATEAAAKRREEGQARQRRNDKAVHEALNDAALTYNEMNPGDYERSIKQMLWAPELEKAKELSALGSDGTKALAERLDMSDTALMSKAATFDGFKDYDKLLKDSGTNREVLRSFLKESGIRKSDKEINELLADYNTRTALTALAIRERSGIDKENFDKAYNKYSGDAAREFNTRVDTAKDKLSTAHFDKVRGLLEKGYTREESGSDDILAMMKGDKGSAYAASVAIASELSLYGSDDAKKLLLKYQKSLGLSDAVIDKMRRNEALTDEDLVGSNIKLSAEQANKLIGIGRGRASNKREKENVENYTKAWSESKGPIAAAELAAASRGASVSASLKRFAQKHTGKNTMTVEELEKLLSSDKTLSQEDRTYAEATLKLWKDYGYLNETNAVALPMYGGTGVADASRGGASTDNGSLSQNLTKSLALGSHNPHIAGGGGSGATNSVLQQLAQVLGENGLTQQMRALNVVLGRLEVKLGKA